MRSALRRTLVASLVVLAGCGSGASGSPDGVRATVTPSATSLGTPSPEICPSTSTDPAASAGATGCPSGGGASGPGAGAGGSGGSGHDGTLTKAWSESVAEQGDGVSSLITQDYRAVAAITLTKVDIGAWTISGWADVTSSYTSDFESHFTSALGPCDSHYTDDASGGGRVDVDGGLEARDGFYQFYVNIGGLDGSNATVRDDSGCSGTNTSEVVPWSVAPTTVGGSGEYTGTTLSGSQSVPRTGGQDMTAWTITIDP
ncbi:MAG TPA: hypothetical protein VFX65_06480 [Candidatus Limnocylindrales bacterium]|nr:hypothetical protein [Candidatus Limnocylindrales bacterium]